MTGMPVMLDSCAAVPGQIRAVENLRATLTRRLYMEDYKVCVMYIIF